MEEVKNVIIWGNHSKTQYPDVEHGYVTGFPSVASASSSSSSASSHPLRSALNDDAWLSSSFLDTVQDRGLAIIKARGGPGSAASAASSCVDHVRDWVLGTKKGEFVSMGVYSDGKVSEHHKAQFSEILCNVRSLLFARRFLLC